MKKNDVAQFMTQDPKYGVPALTTLLYKVCDNDEDKFEEALRLVGLFMDKVQEIK